MGCEELTLSVYKLFFFYIKFWVVWNLDPPKHGEIIILGTGTPSILGGGERD